MKLPLQVVFRNIESSQWIEDVIRERAAKLDRFCEYIMSCRVIVDIPHRHHHSGNFFRVRIDISTPGKEIVVNREPDEHTSAKDMSAVLRDAFDSAKRQLETYVRERRHQVKTHIEQPSAKIKQLFPDEDYGFLETSDGRDIYFHANSIIGERFEHLKIGDSVTFVEEDGEKGPQASTVRYAQG